MRTVKGGGLMRCCKNREAYLANALMAAVIMILISAIGLLLPSNAHSMGLLKCWDNDGDGFDDFMCGGDDCDDSDPSVSPDALEVCDDIDNNCDGDIDEFCDCWDADGDGHYAEECGGLDCDDTDPWISPDAFEDCYDGIDNDCDGEIDEWHEWCDCWDDDHDGYFAEECGGDDCDDADPGVNPGQMEMMNNGIDDDCDGNVDGNVQNEETDPPENRDKIFEIQLRFKFKMFHF